MACIQIQSSYSGRFIFLHLSTLPRPDFPAFLAAMERKNITDLFCFERAHYKVFIFCAFFHGACKPATILTYLKPETSGDWTQKIWQDGTFFLYPFFVLNIPFYLLYFLSLIWILFPLFVCFDTLWQLATTHATGTQIVRAKMTSLDAISCRGNKSSSRSLALSLAFAAQNKKSTARA